MILARYVELSFFEARAQFEWFVLYRTRLHLVTVIQRIIAIVKIESSLSKRIKYDDIGIVIMRMNFKINLMSGAMK